MGGPRPFLCHRGTPVCGDGTASRPESRQFGGGCAARSLLVKGTVLSLSGSPRRPAPSEPTLALDDVRVLSDAGAVLVLAVRKQRLVIAKRNLQQGTTVRHEGDLGRVVLTERYANAIGVL